MSCFMPPYRNVPGDSLRSDFVLTNERTFILCCITLMNLWDHYSGEVIIAILCLQMFLK